MPLNLPAALAPSSSATKNVGDAWSFNGLSGGGSSGPGTFQIIELEGLEDIPSIRSLASDLKRGQRHGGFLAPDYLDPRIITMTVLARANDNPTLAAMMEQLKSAFILDPNSISEKVFTFYGNTRQLNCRCKRRAFKYDAKWLQTFVECVIQLEAIDPRMYGTVLNSYSASLPVFTGASFNFTWNVNFGVVTNSGIITALNAGNFNTSPIITIAGPVDNPIVENITAGKRLAFALTINSGDQLVIDTDAHSVLYYVAGSSIGASRRSSMTTDSQWWELMPGSNTIRYSANTTKVGSIMSLQYRDAWV